LLGPQGCGAVILGEGVKLQTLIEGGNGVDSLLGEMPDEAPERYEAGTLPIPAIVGFSEGISAIEQVGIDNVERHERGLFELAKDGLSKIGRVKLYCSEYSGSVLLFSVCGYDSERVCEYLANKNICVRGGYHCAALAHKTLGTVESGAIRVSFGIFNSENDVEALCAAIKKLI
jgi:selenocysteine lyase/cysteine desulfurase